MKILAIGVVVTWVLYSCNPSPRSMFEKVNPEDSHLDFTNRVVETDSINLAFNYFFYNGAGVAVCDFNNDGQPDIFLTGNHVPSRLYLNEGDLRFRDVSEVAGVLNQYWCSGATFVDINGDQWQDIFISTVGQDEPNLLYVNQGTNADGIPVFRECAEEYGLNARIPSTHAAFLDFDRDNDLDLFVGVNIHHMNNRNETRPRNQKIDTQDRFYRNNGDNTFTEISEEAGITNEGYTLGVAVNDINNDGWPDIYVANDFLPNDLLYINNQQGGFEEKASEYFRHASQNGMGVDIADVNRDGLMDITVVDMLPRSNRRRKLMMTPLNYDLFEYRKELGYIPQHVRNTLQLNRGTDAEGQYHFSEVGSIAGMYSTDWSWAPLWADYDNSGTLDLFITNGYHKDLTDLDFSTGLKKDLQFGSEEYSYDYQMEVLASLRSIKARNYLFRNNGEIVLEDISQASGINEPSFSHGSAFADLDNDGDLELIVNNLGQQAFLYRNTTLSADTGSNKNNYLKIDLEGPGKNTNAIGTHISLFSSQSQQFHFHSPVRGYLSSMSETLHFGLGKEQLVDRIVVRWPNGVSQTISNVEVNQLLRIRYNPESKKAPMPSRSNFVFQDVTDSLKLDYHHIENHFIDFKDQPLLLKMYSREGPALAVGDVNGDSLDDFIVGGAAGQAATMFIQQPDGFQSQPFLAEDSAYEDMGVLFFDLDNDKDQDLYVVSGGSEHPAGSELYEDRLYINEGNHFVRSYNLPRDTGSGGTVRGGDFDRDGDIDLLVGGKISPGSYPQSPLTKLLLNESGKLVDKTPQPLRQAGMITDALWTDFNNDGWLDLIAVGEWTDLLFFINQKGNLSPHTQTGLPATSGWWNSITSGDYDSDGDIDYVVGNFGQNSYITATPDMPVQLYAEDYNEDGEIDPVLSYYSEDDSGELQEFPIHTRDALIDQIIAYKRRFKDYLSFAEAGFSDVLRPDDRKNTLVLRSVMLSSSYVENLGNGKFAIRPLPTPCQIAPVYGMLSEDVNHDGKLDIILSGNQYSAEPVFGNYDASMGQLMLGDGQGKFKLVSPSESGLFLDNDQKSLVQIYAKTTPTAVAASNSGSLKAYQQQLKPSPSRIIDLKPMDVRAEITWMDGRTSVQEFYYGNTYLSQNSRKFAIYDYMQNVVVYNSLGESRKIK